MTVKETSKISYRVLTAEQLELLHVASLELLQRTGVRFHHSEALGLFKEAGAHVSDENLVRIPPNLVEWALGVAPKIISIYDLNNQLSMVLGESSIYYGVGSDCMFIYDPYSGNRRRALRRDIVQGMRLVNTLPHIDFVMSMFVPSDVPVEQYESCQMEIMLQENTKPIVSTGIEADSTRKTVTSAAVRVGGLEVLQRYPCVLNYINPPSAFQHNQESVERLLFAAANNLPIIYAPGNSRGTTAPMSVPGMLATGNAGQLAGLVLTQLKREGSPFILNNPGVGAMDMSTMVDLYACPDGGFYGWDLAYHYDLPIFCSAGASDAKVFDAQATAETALILFANTIRGAHLIQNIGYLDSAMTGSFELVVFCNEVIGWLKRYLRKIEITQESLALDVIQAVGPDGNFLETDHTLQHVRQEWFPDLFDRSDFDKWLAAGSTTLQQRANRKVREILEKNIGKR